MTAEAIGSVVGYSIFAIAFFGAVGCRLIAEGDTEDDLASGAPTAARVRRAARRRRARAAQSAPSVTLDLVDAIDARGTSSVSPIIPRITDDLALPNEAD